MGRGQLSASRRESGGRGNTNTQRATQSQMESFRAIETSLRRDIDLQKESLYLQRPGSIPGTVREYVLDTGLSGRGIELYIRDVSSDGTASFGGGTTAARGYFNVAQRVANLEPDITKWRRRRKS